MKRTLLAAISLSLIAVSCDHSEQPVEVDDRPSFVINDAAHSGSNGHFYFLPPVVPAPAYSGHFDGGLSPAVEVCELSGSSCGTVLATFTTTTGPGSETVRVEGEHYIVNWHTNEFGLDPNEHYRVTVSVDGRELGYADVDIVGSGRELKNVDTGEYIDLMDGRTLPVKFRIEEGALACSPEFHVDFNDYSTGDAPLPPPPGIVWSSYDAGEGSMTVVASAGDLQDQPLLLDSPGGTVMIFGASSDCEPPSSGRYLVSFDLLGTESADPDNDNFGPITRIVSSNGADIEEIYFGPYYGIEARINPADPTDIDIVGTWLNDLSVHFELTIDLDARTTQFGILDSRGDAHLSPVLPFANSSVVDLAGVEVYFNRYATFIPTYAAIDNISVTSTP